MLVRRAQWEGLLDQPAVYKTETGGLLKSLMTWAIPLSFLAIRALSHSVLFVSLCRSSRQFVALSNTYITRENGTPPPGTPKKSDLKLCVGRHTSITIFLLGPFLHARVGIRMCGVSQEEVLHR